MRGQIFYFRGQKKSSISNRKIYMTLAIFLILAVVSVVFALLVVFSKNPVHSVLYLILTFFTIAGQYVLLNAQFLAVVHIIVYAGAIMVLFLFVLMLLNLNQETEPQKSTLWKVAGAIAAGLLLVTLTGALRGSGELALGIIEQGQTVQGTGHVAVIRAEGFLIDRQRSFLERLRHSVDSLFAIEQRQVVQAHCHVGVIGAEGFLSDRKRSLVERLRSGVIALLGVQQRQIVQARRQPRIIRAEFFSLFEG